MERKHKESLSSCVKELTELSKQIKYWAESIESSKSYSSLNTLQLKFRVVEDKLGKIVVCMESHNLSALASRLEREYGNLIKMTEYFDKLCKDPRNKDIKPGELESAPQELQIYAGSFVCLLEEIANQISSVIEENIKTTKKPAETEQKAAHSIRRRMWIWLKTHPHIYGLIGGVIFLILFFVLGLVTAQWRNWCWGTAGIALLVLILSLLGGRSPKGNAN